MLTASKGRAELYVDMYDCDGVRKYARYSYFHVEGSSVNYQLHVSGYSGTAGDSLATHRLYQLTQGIMILTKDQKLTVQHNLVVANIYTLMCARASPWQQHNMERVQPRAVRYVHNWSFGCCEYVCPSTISVLTVNTGLSFL